jgi:hypothetical protein
VGDLRYLEGSYDRFLVGEQRLTVEDITFGRGGFAPALPGPGLGVTIDPSPSNGSSSRKSIGRSAERVMQHAGPRRVVIQRNPTSGTGKKRGELLSLVRRLKVHGFSPRLFSSRQRLDRYLSNPERRAEVFCVVAAGGDGTVGDVVNRCHGLPVAILALGTENLIARYLKLPRDGSAVADMIAAGRRIRPMRGRSTAAGP